MDALRLEIEDDISSVMDSLEIPESLWKKILGPSREISQGALTMPCFPLALFSKALPMCISPLKTLEAIHSGEALKLR